MQHTEHSVATGTNEAAVVAPVVAAPPEIIDFIRYCYQRRRIGWPELYDEMCGVAARGEFRGMDYDRLAALGVRFSLCDMPRLAALAQRVVQDERRRRVAIAVAGTAPPVAISVSPTSAGADVAQSRVASGPIPIEAERSDHRSPATLPR